jgi:hypothetical protein
MAEDRPERGKQTKIEVQVDDDVAQGMYINLAMVHHDENAFTIDAMYLAPHQQRAKLRGRIISSPKHTKRLLHALQEQVSRYEQRFGTIDLSGPDPAAKLLH